MKLMVAKLAHSDRAPIDVIPKGLSWSDSEKSPFKLINLTEH